MVCARLGKPLWPTRDTVGRGLSCVTHDENSSDVCERMAGPIAEPWRSPRKRLGTQLSAQASLMVRATALFRLDVYAMSVLHLSGEDRA